VIQEDKIAEDEAAACDYGQITHSTKRVTAQGPRTTEKNKVR